jgi:thiamine-phosphate pyrophosphorylase
VIGPNAFVGLSTHTPEQIDEALKQPIAYLAVGPVFGTRTKDTGYEAVGLELVRHAAARAASAGDIPVVAIGGITLASAATVLAAGARSVAVITDLVSTGDPAARAAEFVASLG